MDSIKNIYKIGHGPSSSHTMAPFNASIAFKEEYPADHYQVILYGSLALTGKGHLTDQVIKDALGPDTEVIFNLDENFSYHPNAMRFNALDDNNQIIGSKLLYSIGGGEVRSENEKRCISNIYAEGSMQEILALCKKKNWTLLDYINNHEDLNEYLMVVLQVMQEAFKRGINAKDNLPGPLQIKRKSGKFYKTYLENHNHVMLLYSVSLAVSEENACGGIVSTAPTCGSAGVLPAVLIFAREILGKREKELIDAMKIAGLFGLLAKSNASISGAEVGCQGEVGVACSMASAALCFLKGGTNNQIEYAAEIALEHHLGLTCDPVNGQVQIPCIERNAIASLKAVGAAEYAINTDGFHLISFDQVLKTMMETGLDLSKKYKETSTGGLAKGREDIC